MKKVILLLISFIFMSTPVLAVVVDNFEDYTPGNVEDVASPPWIITTPADATEIPAIVEDNGNQYLESVCTSINVTGIENGATGTVFFRVMLPAGRNPDCSFGMSDTVGSTGDWGEFESYCTLVGTELRVRDGSAQIAVATLQEGIWYNVWIVADNSSDTHDVYLTTDLTEPTDADRIADNLGFRNGTSDTLGCFKIYGRGNATTAQALFFDDIYIMPGVNLSLDMLKSQIGQSNTPAPFDGELDVLKDVVLTWKAGEYAGSHDVYLSTSLEDVNDASRANPMGIQLAQGSASTSLDAGRLDYGQTYYWRVDEVNATPDQTIIPGEVWSFDVEPYSYVVPSDLIQVTASSTSDTSSDANALLGVGLVDGVHSNLNADMWFSNGFDFTPVLDFEFSKMQVLDKVSIYNSNTTGEITIGWGAKDIVMETSVDGEEWTVVEGATQLTRATGSVTYDTPDVFDLGNTVVKYVRIQLLNSWGGLPVGTSLAEVVFNAVPMYARNPMPVVATEDVDPMGDLAWRQGRQAAQSQVSLDVNEMVVADGLAQSQTVSGASISMQQLGVELSETYYWQVDEVNDSEAVDLWTGDVWRFSTADYITIDNFDSYTNLTPNRPFNTWFDGLSFNADPVYFPNGYAGNGTGSGIGYDIWTLSSEYYDTDTMEMVFTVDGSSQSMPVYYSGDSRIDRTFEVPQDWTAAGVTTLVVNVRGVMGNDPGSLYVKINNATVTNPDTSIIAEGLWTQWNIDLSTVNTNLSNVQTMNIGINTSGSGLIYIDEIRLYKNAPEVVVASDPGTAGMTAKFSLDGNLTDTSGNGLGTGTVTGMPAYIDGYEGQAMEFYGDEEYAELPVGGVISSSDSITIACWTDFSNEGDAWQRVWDFGSGEGANPYIFLCPRTGTTGPVRVAIRTETIAESVIESRATLPSGWQHVAVVIDSETMTMKLYINGTLEAEGDTEVIPSDLGVTTQNYLANSQYAADALYVGAIDEVIFYDRALTEGEIRYMAGDR